MGKLVERLKTKRFSLGVKQHALVLEFTTAIQDAMIARGVTQSWLARRLGKTRSWISKVFRHKPNLTFFTAVEIANALSLDVEIRAIRRVQSPMAAFSNIILFTQDATRGFRNVVPRQPFQFRFAGSQFLEYATGNVEGAGTSVVRGSSEVKLANEPQNESIVELARVGQA